jgi:hypothetical protein
MFAETNPRLHAAMLERGLPLERARRVEYGPAPPESPCTACGNPLSDLRADDPTLAHLDTPVLTGMFVVVVVDGMPYCTDDEAFEAAAAA